MRTQAFSTAFAAAPFGKTLAAVSRAFLACSLLSAAAFAANPSAAAPRPGSPAPDFTLTDAAGKSHALSAYKGKWVVLEWVNYDCPFVRKHYGSGNMQKLQKESRGKGAVWLSINSSAPGKQGHFEGEALAARIAKEKGAMDAYLLDPDGKAGRLYKAKTTPHMFVINPEGVVTYAGAIDDKPSTDLEDIAGASNYVRAALDAGLAGKPVETSSTAPYGCGVKYGDK